jgi:hypothetical protein
MSKRQAIASREELSEDYWNQLIDLVEQGEISSAFAHRVCRDMFEEPAAGEVPRLRERFWQLYLLEAKEDFWSLLNCPGEVPPL